VFGFRPASVGRLLDNIEIASSLELLAMTVKGDE